MAGSRQADPASGWCLEVATARDAGRCGDAWRMAFDQLATSCATRWAGPRGAERRPEAYRLAMMLADLGFDRGLPGESQRRYEQAAGSRRTRPAAVGCACRGSGGVAALRQ